MSRGRRERRIALIGILMAALATSGGLLNGMVVGRGMVDPAASASSSTFGFADSAGNSTAPWIVDPPLPSNYLVCEVVPKLLLDVLGNPGCDTSNSAAWEAWAAAVELDTMQNLLTLAGNSFNHTAAEIANLNATAQELLSYYEGRAEALVPYFLNVSWNESTEAQLAIDSGLVPAIEGLALAYANQQYQDWNSTVASWNNLFGYFGTYAHTGSPSGTGLNENLTRVAHHPGSGIPLMQDGTNYTVSAPWEIWNGTAQSFFFNMAPGGTIVCANLTLGYSAAASCPVYKVFDFTRGTSFVVPDISLSNFAQSHDIPVVTTENDVGQFDLLKLVCETGCTGPLEDVETIGGYAFLNVSSQDPDYTTAPPFSGPSPQGTENTMTYRMFIDSAFGNASLLVSGQGGGWVPTLDYTLCGMVNGNFVGHACDSGPADPAGNTTATGTGPSAVAASNDSSLRYAPTFQNLLNNTLNDSEVYYLTLRAITNGGRVDLPPDCVIPGPSAAFPTSTNPGNYRISLDDGLAAYWGYLNAVGKAFDNSTTYGLEFCGSPALELGFNWSASWALRLQVGASFYFANASGDAVYPNGTRDAGATYSNPASWPVRNVDPALLFPYEYQANIPLGEVTPIPANNPMAALLVNYTGNPLYGSNISGRSFGIPTYLQLYGEGNFVYSNGTTSSESGGSSSKGDAVYISSCLLNNVSENPCSISVTYFNAFVYGHENALVGPPPPPVGGVGGVGGGLGSTTDCGFGNLDAWYDSWAGYIGSAVAGAFGYVGGLGSDIPLIGGAWSYFWNGLGCVLAWVVLIIVVFLLAWVVVWVVRRLYEAWHG